MDRKKKRVYYWNIKIKCATHDLDKGRHKGESNYKEIKRYCETTRIRKNGETTRIRKESLLK